MLLEKLFHVQHIMYFVAHQVFLEESNWSPLESIDSYSSSIGNNSNQFLMSEDELSHHLKIGTPYKAYSITSRMYDTDTSSIMNYILSK